MKLFKPTINLIKSTFWKIHYRLFLGKDYQTRMEKASNIFSNVIDSTNGRVSHFHDIKGERIRGYHKRIKFNANVISHPLIQKYS
jgi:hypothetical protein